MGRIRYQHLEHRRARSWGDRCRPRLFLPVLMLCWLVTLGSAQEPAPQADERRLDFETMVAPILATRCLECHGSLSPEGDLDLSRQQRLLQGGESGPALVPGNPPASPLWIRIEADEMPPEHPLTDREKSILRNWIEQGGTWDGGPLDPFRYSSDERAGYDWWSLQPLRDQPIPLLPGDDWSLNPIDRFVIHDLAAIGVAPSPRATPRQLVRRLYFDLIGLPPPPEAIDRFESNPSQQAWVRLVDELLSSPRYGERWAQHWLDVARFGESEGYEYNFPRDDAWHYRDWVIRSLNADLPYNRFAHMQIAGDATQGNSVEGAAAVGFLVAGVHNTVLGKSEAMKRASRHEELEEIAGTLCQTFLGLTANCARCHDHKFDPISNLEYYQLVAALDGITHGVRSISVATSEEARAKLLASRNQTLRDLQLLSLQRGTSLSESANAVSTRREIQANQANETYRVSFKASPSVWAAAPQATTATDELLVRVLRQDGVPLASHWVQAQPWDTAGKRQSFAAVDFEYQGDGTGPVKLWIGSFPHEGRFGGAIDDLVIHDSQGQPVFADDFNGLQDRSHPGIQADTNLPVYWGMKSADWIAEGLNSIHAVEHEPGNLAIQLYSGSQDRPVAPATAIEEQLAAEHADLQQQLNGATMFTVVSRQPPPMRILLRGDARQLGPEVEPGGLKAMANLDADWKLTSASSDSQRRLRLADWLTNSENGPFHRVMVNRMWHHHFGQGIVETPNDFGFNGARPSHPELLEWLSVWWRERGYSLKQLHRLIVTSATYQQSSNSADHSQALLAMQLDQGNRRLWRQNPRRLDAEALRDAFLDMAAVLNQRASGPGYRDVSIETIGAAHYYRPFDSPEQALQRRTIYRWHVRGQRSALLESFDCPDPSVTAPKRNITTTPAQALSLWNDSFVLRMADGLARRIEDEVGSAEVDAAVRRGWQLVLGRMPDEAELLAATQLVNKHDLALLCRVLLNSSEAIVID